MTMFFIEVYSTSNMSRYRNLRSSRTKNVRCASRFLVSCHLLGPESRVFELLLEEEVQKHDFDEDVTSLKLTRRRIWSAS